MSGGTVGSCRHWSPDQGRARGEVMACRGVPLGEQLSRSMGLHGRLVWGSSRNPNVNGGGGNPMGAAEEVRVVRWTGRQTGGSHRADPDRDRRGIETDKQELTRRQEWTDEQRQGEQLRAEDPGRMILHGEGGMGPPAAPRKHRPRW